MHRLTWADIDHGNALIRVHGQLTRYREHGPLKTEAGKRDLILAPAIGKLLRERWLASAYKAPYHFVFSNTLGRSLDYRDVGEDFRATVKRAGITTAGERLSLHSLRHGFASLLISQGLNVVFVSRQLAHANPNITLGTYAHLYARADHVETVRAALDASYTTIGPECPGTAEGASRPPSCSVQIVPTVTAAESPRSSGSRTLPCRRTSCTPP